MITMQKGFKLLAYTCVAAMFLMTGCDDGSSSGDDTPEGSWFTVSVDGTYEVPEASWMTIDANTNNIEFGFAGQMNTEVSGGELYLPLNAASGTYTVTTTDPGSSGTVAAGTTYINISGETNSFTAQSGSVTVTKNGDKYTIDFTALPALSEETPQTSATLSAHLAY